MFATLCFALRAMEREPTYPLADGSSCAAPGLRK